jgi:hypothetical protein
VRRRNGSRPLDLGPITRQPSDRTGTARGLPLGFQLSAYRDSQEQENRNTSSLESESARLDRDCPLVGTHGRDPGHWGSPDEEVIHRSSAHRDNRDPGVKLSVYFGIAKRETVMSGGQLPAHRRRRMVPP